MSRQRWSAVYTCLLDDKPCAVRHAAFFLAMLDKGLCAACVQNDFTPEEEEEVRRENQWAFE